MRSGVTFCPAKLICGRRNAKKPVASVAGMKNAVRKGANDGLNRNLAVVVR
jgi:hypothetical protein